MSIRQIKLCFSLLVVGLLSSCLGDQTPPKSDPPPPVISLTVSPGTVTLPTGGTVDFSASVSGGNNSAVSWSVEDNATEVGAITNAGTYTAPASVGIFLVTATSEAKSSAVASATVTVSSSLDATFGSNGTVTTGFGTTNDELNAVAVQLDGKIVVAGFAFGVQGNINNDFAVARYDTNGTLDSTFGIDGKVTSAIGNGDDEVNALAIQSDGKIVVGGSAVIGSNKDFALMRYNANGSVDTSFSGDGEVTTGIGSGDSEVKGLAIQADGNIVVAGVSLSANNRVHEFTLARYDGNNGSLDPSFGTGGIVTTQIGDNSSYGQAIAIQEDGMILVAGFSSQTESPSTESPSGASNFDFTLARYGTDGTLDATFGTNGVVSTSIGGGHDIATAIAIQSDGKIIVAGSPLAGVSPDVFALVRYNAVDGSLDATFGSAGIVTTSIGTVDNRPLSLAIQSDDKIIAGGFSFSTENQRDFSMTRYLPVDGSLDQSFGVAGIEISPFSTSIDEIRGLAIQSDGKIIAAGITFKSDNTTDFQLARYNP